MLQWTKGRKEGDAFLTKKNGRKQNCATIMISIDGKRTVFFSEVEIRMGIVWAKILKRRILKKS